MRIRKRSFSFVFDFFSLIFFERSLRRPFFFCLLGMSLAMSIVLATISLMSGFDKSLKKSLRSVQGDFYFYHHRQAPFSLDSFYYFLGQEKQEPENVAFSAFYQTQGFLLPSSQQYGKKSTGVLIHFVDEFSMKEVTKREEFSLLESDKAVLLGSELAKDLGIKKGEELVLLFSLTKEDSNSSFLFFRGIFQGVVNHNLFEKDSRFVYAKRSSLQHLTGRDDLINRVSFNSFRQNDESGVEMSSQLPIGYKVEPYWSDFSTLLEAVKVEKVTLLLILQLIVLIAGMGLTAFLFFFYEEKKEMFFLLLSLGMSKRRLCLSLLVFLNVAHLFAVLISCGMLKIFNEFFFLTNLFSKGKAIYNLVELVPSLELTDYLQVFLLGYLLVILLALWFFYFLFKKPVMALMRSREV